MIESINNDSTIKDVYSLLRMVDMHVSHRKNMQVREKSFANLVTDIDLFIERLLVAGLQHIDNIPCLTEETNSSVVAHSYWVVDPIDGTTNLVHGYPSYCISVAKVFDNITEYGFVYNLITKEFFVSVRGNGAYLLSSRSTVSRRLQVSNTQEMADSIIGFGCPYDKTKVKALFERTCSITEICQDVKRSGPASLDICYVASGRLDGYFEYDLKEWDYKAAKLILEEAGGMITDWNSRAITTGTSNVLVSNGKLHAELLKHLR